MPTKKINEDKKSGVHRVFSVSGCCFAIDIPKFKQMGAFDPHTFLYNEENILGIQAEKAGLNVLIDLDVSVDHKHGESSGNENDFIRTEYIKSTLYYWYRYRHKGKHFLTLIIIAYVSKLKMQRHEGIHPFIIERKAKHYLNELLEDKLMNQKPTICVLMSTYTGGVYNRADK